MTKPAKNTIKFGIIFCVVLLVISATLLLPKSGKAQNASLYLSPSTGTYAVGNTFSIAVKVNSGGVAINASEASLVFNPNELEVASISKTGSIFTLWTEEPTFSNSSGTIDFGGGSPTSFSGSAGTLIIITFKAKLAGSTQVIFSSGAVLAADGKGTNILASMGSGRYTLEVGATLPPIEKATPTPTPTPAFGVPSAPKVSSATHPDSEKWYNNQDPEFSWLLPSDVDGVSIYLSKSPSSNPGPLPDGLFSSKSYEDADDGTWYFHIKARNSFGWSETVHFKIQIDTQPPEPFEITVRDGEETTNPRPILFFESQDELSGIEYYEVKIGEGDSFAHPTVATESNPFEMPVQAPGKHPVIIKAVDRAGNYTLATTEMNILPIEAPLITDYPMRLQLDSFLSLKGISLPEVNVSVYIQRGNEEAKTGRTISDRDGNWSFTFEKLLEEGDYKVWTEAVDSQGARSEASEKVAISVSPPAFIRIGTLAISYLIIIIILLALIALIILLSLYVLSRLKLQKTKLRKEAREAKDSLHRAFSDLRKNIKEQLEALEKAKTKRKLTEEEEKIRKALEKDLTLAEKLIEKEIKDIIKYLK